MLLGTVSAWRIILYFLQEVLTRFGKNRNFETESCLYLKCCVMVFLQSFFKKAVKLPLRTEQEILNVFYMNWSFESKHDFVRDFKTD